MLKRFFLFLIMTSATIGVANAEDVPIPIRTHTHPDELEVDRTPARLPIKVFLDLATNIVKIWCDNDNIQAEVYVYDESGAIEVYSPYMNVCLQLISEGNHQILLKGDGWEAEGSI